MLSLEKTLTCLRDIWGADQIGVKESSSKHLEVYSIPEYTNFRNGGKRHNLLFNAHIPYFITLKIIFLPSLKKFLQSDGEHRERTNINGK